MRIGNREFKTEQNTYIMGILNVTPDSFSDGGKYDAIDRALYHVEEMLHDGMDIVDIGGESTRPGHEYLPAEQEIHRVLPVIEAVKARFDVPVSLDTYKAATARAGISAGADMINDVWGLKYEDSQMAQVIASSGLPCCLMHNRKEAAYDNLMEDVAADLSVTLRLAEAAGIREDRIILDPGIGFGKTYEQNLVLLDELQCLSILGCPLLLGASRKSVIGLTLDLPASERLEGTLVTTVFGVMSGCSFIRVHDIKANKRTIQMTEAIRNAGLSRHTGNAV